VQGYYDGIVGFLADAVEERFVRQEHRDMLLVEREPPALLERLRAFQPDAVLPKWIDREET
jgi:predicted Rossmann-fold nucleotide-binding protein